VARRDTTSGSTTKGSTDGKGSSSVSSGSIAEIPDGPPDESGLTPRQRRVLDEIRSSVERRGYPPSMREIGEAVGLTSSSSVSHQLATLERKGYIKRAYNESRGIELMPSDALPRAMSLPLLGTVAAGLPIEAIQMPETIGVPEDLVRRAGNHYVLRVRGNSMIDEQIRDGDFVIVNEKSTADNGEMVIALIDGTSATARRPRSPSHAASRSSTSRSSRSRWCCRRSPS